MDFTKTLVLIVALSGLLVQTTAVRTPQARVWSMCKPTTNPVLCFKTILPQVGAKFNIYKALEIEVNETQKHVLKIVAAIAKPSFFATGKIAPALATCKEQYDSIVDNVAETIKLVSQRNAIEARFKFSAVVSYHSACDDQFGVLVSPFAADSKAVFDLAANCLDLMKAIEDRDMRRSAKN